MQKEIIRFGTNLKILRNKNGMTQEQLAEKIYVRRQTIANWEGVSMKGKINGKRNVRFRRIQSQCSKTQIKELENISEDRIKKEIKRYRKLLIS